MRDFVADWAHWDQFEPPNSALKVDIPVLKSRRTLWRLVNAHVKLQGLFVLLKLFNHASHFICSKERRRWRSTTSFWNDKFHTAFHMRAKALLAGAKDSLCQISFRLENFWASWITSHWRLFQIRCLSQEKLKNQSKTRFMYDVSLKLLRCAPQEKYDADPIQLGSVASEEKYLMSIPKKWKQ